jgi:hypothetical protein
MKCDYYEADKLFEDAISKNIVNNLKKINENVSNSIAYVILVMYQKKNSKTYFEAHHN